MKQELIASFNTLASHLYLVILGIDGFKVKM